MIEMKTTGLRELHDNLAALDAALARRIIRSAERTALTPATRAIRAATYTTVTRRTGLLKAGLGARGIKKYQGPGKFAAGVFAKPASVGFLKRAKAAGRIRQRRRKKGDYKEINEPFYWRFIEFGTAKMPARSYVAAAFGGVAGDVLERFRRALQTGIERASRERPHK